jgi:hypothetical protein
MKTYIDEQVELYVHLIIMSETERRLVYGNS